MNLEILVVNTNFSELTSIASKTTKKSTFLLCQVVKKAPLCNINVWRSKTPSFANCRNRFPFKSPVITPAGWAGKGRNQADDHRRRRRTPQDFQGPGNPGSNTLGKNTDLPPIHELAFPDDQFRAAAGAHLLYASR